MPAPSSVVPAASGYRVYAALTNPIFAKALIPRYYAGTVTGRITSSDIVPSEIKQEGDTVVFRVAPKAEIFEYQKNQDLEVSQLNTRPVTMTIDRAYYYNLKLDYVDEKQIPDVMTWVREFRESAVQVLAEQTDFLIQSELPHQVDCHNKGRNAGKRTGAFDLGTSGAPVTVTSANIMQVIGRLSAVLTEANVPNRGRFLLLPSSAAPLLWSNTILANAYSSGMSKSIVLTDGEVIPDLLGFDIIFSNNTPIYTDPVTDQMTFTILAGLKSATGYVMQLNNQEVIDKDPRSFSKYWRGLVLWGAKVIKPEDLAVLYATFDYNTTP